jgi:hypothetical protein
MGELSWAERVAEETGAATPRAFWRGMKPFFDERRWRDGEGGGHREDLPVHCDADQSPPAGVTGMAHRVARAQLR